MHTNLVHPVIELTPPDLHHTLNNYNNNSTIQLLLHYYRVLGMGETALEAFKELGVKHIQVSSG